VLLAAAVCVLLGAKCSLFNKAPSVPVVTGPTQGVAGVPVEFKATATDPEGDSIAFAFDWGDNTALASRGDGGRAFEAASSFLKPDRFREVRSVCPASGGSIWVVGVDWGWGQGGQWYACLFGKSGERLSGEIPLLPTQGLTRLNNVVPIGTLQDGSLVLDIAEEGPDNYRHLAKVRSDGLTEVTGVIPPHRTGQPYVDHDGVAHILVTRRHIQGYMQVDMTAKGLPTVLSLVYSQPFAGLSSAPDYLRWEDGLPGCPLEGGFFSDGPRRLLVATTKGKRDDSVCYLYRVDSKTLALLGAGQLNLARDIFREWSGPVVGRTLIVRSGSGGYWLFTSTGDAPPKPTVVAYRLKQDLTPVRPSVAAAVAAEPFDEAPDDAVVSVFCPTPQHKELPTSGGRAVQVTLLLKFAAFGSDGRLYYQAREDSFPSYEPRE
jgi:hypothetical protein